MTRDYQAEYDQDQVKKYGGSSGDFTADPAQMGERQQEVPADGYEQAPAAQEWAGEGYAPDQYVVGPETGYDPGLDFGVADESYQEPAEFDPFAEDAGEQVRQMIREEVGYDPAEAADPVDWQAYDEQQAASAEVEQAEAAQQGLENLDSLIDSALGGRGRHMLAEFPEFREAVVERLSDEWQATVTAGVAQGYDAEMVNERLTASAPAYVAAVVKSVQADFGNAQILREGRMHFRGASR